jgi:hypothetical protein
VESLFQAGSFLWQAAYKQVLLDAIFHVLWGVAFLFISLGLSGGVTKAWARARDEAVQMEDRDLFYSIAALVTIGACFFLGAGIFSLQDGIRGFVTTDYQTAKELLALAKGVIK